MSTEWVDVCGANDIDSDDVIRFDHGTRTLAVYRLGRDRYCATDGRCTHAGVHLADGFVNNGIIECPKHNGRFDICTGAAQGVPVTVNLRTYSVRVEGGRVLVELPTEAQ